MHQNKVNSLDMIMAIQNQTLFNLDELNCDLLPSNIVLFTDYSWLCAICAEHYKFSLRTTAIVSFAYSSNEKTRKLPRASSTSHS